MRTVESRQNELIQVWQKFVATPEPIREPKTASVSDVPDDDLIQKAMNAANGPMFGDLWAGGLAGHLSSSEGDMALCSMLAFWTGKDALG